MFMGILPKRSLPGYGRSLAHASLEDVVRPQGQDAVEGCLGDLGRDDHLVVHSCSKSLLASHRDLRCRVSYWLREPRAIQNRFYRSMRLISHRYAYVLTYDDKLCASIPNAVFVAHGGCWVTQPSRAGNVDKSQWMSIVASPKRDTSGHQLRHQIIEWAQQANLPLTPFGRQYQQLDNKEDAHDPFMFSVVVENSRTSNYFTEKLIDSFVCGSLPIYWGAPEIAEYFDPRGMLICQSFDEAISQIRSADQKLFQTRLPYLHANRLRAMCYADPHRLVFDSLLGKCDVPKILRGNTMRTHSRGPAVPTMTSTDAIG